MATVHVTDSNPLVSMPSILALPVLRRQVDRRLAGRSPTRQSLTQLLALDPLTVLRCLRMACSPVYRSTERVLTVDGLIRTLGHTVVLRALSVPPVSNSNAGPLMELWSHGVACAQAARTLARDSGSMDPEQAYLLGLLHDFSEWVHILRPDTGSPKALMNPRSLAAYWHLPRPILEVIEGVHLTRASLSQETYTSVSQLVSAAEVLAELADYWHPGGDEDLSRDLLFTSVTKKNLLASKGLRQDVRSAMREVGIEAAEHYSSGAPVEASERDSLFRRRIAGSVAETALTLLQCNKSPSYRGVITATTSAALRYLGYDRAWYATWLPASGECILRAKADLTPIRLANEKLLPTEQEQAVLSHAFRVESPQLLEADPRDSSGLMHRIGTDQAIAVAMNCEFMSPTFLILDHALSLEPIDLESKTELVQTLAGIASLLIENQLLQRRRKRAQRFALIDPLTQLANRGVGIHGLTREVFRAQRTGTQLTVMMFDLDDFKQLNDTFGHINGDRALCATADVLRRGFRRSDTICRYGGEEFLAVLPETDAEDAAVLATRMFTAVEEKGVEIGLPLTVSIGLAQLRDSNEAAEALLHRADQALYASKAAGRNRFSVDA